MARSSWIVNPEPPYNLIPKDEYYPKRERGLMVMPDLPDFVSPIDGKVVKGRKGYREHCREHNVTGMSDFKETWKQQAKDRKGFTKSRPERDKRLAAITRAYDQQAGKR